MAELMIQMRDPHFRRLYENLKIASTSELLQVLPKLM